MQFHREACVEILDRSNYPSRKAFAAAVGVSPGSLADVLNVDDVTGRPRRTPSTDLIRRIAAELKVPVTAIIKDPEAAAV